MAFQGNGNCRNISIIGGEAPLNLSVDKASTYIVYRVVASGQKMPIGKLEERRRMERIDNRRDMLRLAKKLYSKCSLDALEITVEPTK